MYAQLALGLFLIFSGLGVLLAWALHRYKIYRYRLSGQAALAKADCESKVTVRRALAEQEAAEHLAQAGLPILEAGRAIGLKPSNDETA